MAVRKKKAEAAAPGAKGKPRAKGKAGKAKAKPRERNDRRGLRSHKEGEKPKPRAKPKTKAKPAVKKMTADGCGPTKKKAAGKKKAGGEAGPANKGAKKAAPGKRRAAGAMGVLGVVFGEALARVDAALADQAVPLVAAAAAGATLEAKDRRVMDRFVAALEDSVFWVLASRSPQKWLLGLLESSSKVLLEWENAGMPRNGDKAKSYNLWQVLPWVKGRLRGGDVAWETAPEDIRREYLTQQVRDKRYQADMRRLELKRRKQELIERNDVHAAFGQIAAALRRSGERLAHRCGDEARAIFSEGLERARERVHEFFGDGQGELSEVVEAAVEESTDGQMD